VIILQQLTIMLLMSGKAYVCSSICQARAQCFTAKGSSLIVCQYINTIQKRNH